MQIKKLYIDEDLSHDAVVQRILSHYSDIPTEWVKSADTVYRAVTAAGPDPAGQGKRILHLTRNRGAFVRSCPGTQSYTCCGYKILHIGTYCTMDCAYCILQSYFHPPVLQFFVNHTDLDRELNKLFISDGVHRIGTGEFTDSMIWEPVTDLSRFLVPRFADQSRAVLELKSKTVNIDRLKGIDHNRKTIAAWSLNTRKVIAGDERRTTSLTARLEAAAKCESWGYPLAFHFDPMIIYDGCEEDYRYVVEQIFSYVSAENIVWISLGAFRFMPDLKAIIQQRFETSKIVYGEFITGLDGKMRYFKPLRIHLFKKMVTWLRELAPDVLVYLCMEDDEVWRKSFGFIPEEKGGLPKLLDESAIRHCGLIR
ncbi:MAG: DNA photolyase [Pseudomonadota bacterium]